MKNSKFKVGDRVKVYAFDCISAGDNVVIKGEKGTIREVYTSREIKVSLDDSIYSDFVVLSQQLRKLKMKKKIEVWAITFNGKISGFLDTQEQVDRYVATSPLVRIVRLEEVKNVSKS